MKQDLTMAEVFLDEYIENNRRTSSIEFHKKRYLSSLEWISRYLSGKERVLELSGEGVFTKLVKHCYPEIVIDNLTSDFRYEFPLDNSTYDFILNMEVFEHIKDKDQSALTKFDESGINSFIAESYRVLKNGGYMFLTTPNICCHMSIYKLLMGKDPMMYFWHFREYTKSHIVNTLNENRFFVEESKTVDVWRHRYTKDADKVKRIIEEFGFSTEDRGDDHFFIAGKS